jgi:hypothetical protein
MRAWLLQLIDAQLTNGSWASDKVPATILQQLVNHSDGKELLALKTLQTNWQTRKTDKETKEDPVIGTELALALLETSFQTSQHQWQLLATKARAYLRTALIGDTAKAKILALTTAPQALADTDMDTDA